MKGFRSAVKSAVAQIGSRTERRQETNSAKLTRRDVRGFRSLTLLLMYVTGSRHGVRKDFCRSSIVSNATTLTCATNSSHLQARDSALVVVIHEVEKRIGELKYAIEQDADRSRLTRLATDLAAMVDGLTYLTRRSGRRQEAVHILVGASAL